MNLKTDQLVAITNALFAGAEFWLLELLFMGNSLLLVGVAYMNQREGQTLKVSNTEVVPGSRNDICEEHLMRETAIV